MSDGEEQRSPLVGREVVDELRRIATEHEPDTIAVFVLAGSPERGLALAVSSATEAADTYRLLGHALNAPSLFEVVEDA